MLAESQAASKGWLAFVALVVSSAALIPLVAVALRRRLPDRRSAARRVRPLRFGRSPQARRSPRHAVAFHRAFLTSLPTAGIGLVLIAFVAALGRLDLGGLLAAIAFIAPTFVVMLHSRRRDLAKGPGA